MHHHHSYLKQHPDAIIFVATDTTSWLEVLRSKYGAKVVSLDGSLRSGQYLHIVVAFGAE